MCVSDDDFIDHADAHSAGAKMPRTSWRDMASYKIAHPPVVLVEVFFKRTMPMVGSIRDNVLECRNLASIRDASLPGRLSGEIRVKHAERLEGESV